MTSGSRGGIQSDLFLLRFQNCHYNRGARRLFSLRTPRLFSANSAVKIFSWEAYRTTRRQLSSCTVKKMNHRVAQRHFVPLLIVVLSANVIAQEHPAVTALPNTVYVGADGKYEANPDTAVIEFSISAQEETSGAAYDRASKQADQVRQILHSNGLDPKLAQVGYYAIQPVYDYKTPKRKLVGYRVNTNVSVKLKDFAKIGPILQQLASADITDSQQLNYTLEEKDAAKSKAVEDAYHHARDSAEAVAHAGGRNVGDLIYASVDTFENPLPVRPMAMAAAPRVAMESQPPTAEFSPQTVTITAHVNALFQLK